jgi:hypothetical protein
MRIRINDFLARNESPVITDPAHCGQRRSSRAASYRLSNTRADR